MKRNKKLNILVTGGSGFLGFNLLKLLSKTDHTIINYDTSSPPINLDGVDTIFGDLLDFEKLLKVVEGMDFIYHFAAYADIDKAKDNPLKTIEVNVLGTTYLLEAARKNNVQKIMFASSIYVSSRTGGFYRVSKHSCELLFEEYSKTYGMNYNVLRFGTLYGPFSDESNSVYRYLKTALLKNHIIALGTGDETREYIDVRDAVTICLKLLEDYHKSQTIIITGNHRMKLSELLEMVKEILGNKLEIEYGKGHTAHYKHTPYSYQPNPGKKIIMDSFRDLGQGLVEILQEIDAQQDSD